MFKNYLLMASKVFMRRKLFTLINLVCIVLTLVVLLVITALLNTAFFPDGVEGKSDRFLQVSIIRAEGGSNGRSTRTSPLGYKIVDKYLRPIPSLEAVAAVSQATTVSVYQNGRSTALQMRRADADYWKILDFKVLAGRLPTADDVAQGRLVAVINASTASKLFAESSPLGQSVRVGDQQFAVIGVVEDVIHFNAFADIWAPVTTFPSSDYKQQYFGEFTGLLLAKSAADLPALRLEVERIAKTVTFDDPKRWHSARFWADSKLDLFARLLLDNVNHPDSGAGTLIALLSAIMLLFMMLPALNLVNLNTGRIMERSAEIGVRKAFGATNGQLVGQLIVENVLLCLVGGLLSLLVTAGVLVWLEGSGLIPYLKVSLNWAVFAVGLLITIIFGVLSGVLPALKMARLDPVVALKGAI
jgi:putative ABC transport system permease protein